MEGLSSLNHSKVFKKLSAPTKRALAEAKSPRGRSGVAGLLDWNQTAGRKSNLPSL